MSGKINTVLLVCLFCLAIDIIEVDVKRTFPSDVHLQRTSNPQLDRTDAPMYSEELKTTYYQHQRTPVTGKPHCATANCNKADRRRRKQAQQARTGYKALKLSAVPKNETRVEFPNKKKAKFSRKYDPTGSSDDSGFIPIPRPYGGRTTQRSAERRARLRNSEELLVKESRASPNILGNGNFEILSGGVYSDDESNEIPEGRRMSRGYDAYILPPFQPIPFDAQNFQFPSFYQGRLQVPTHPMYFPRAAF